MLLALAGAMGAFATVAWLRPRDTVSVRNFDSIRIGMRLQEVSDVLGRPPADTNMRHPYAGSYDPNENREAGVVETRFWYSEELTAQVGFDANGLVVWKGAWMAPIPRWRDDSLGARMKRWFRF